MKCPKCGFVGFDHVATCAKCGKELDAARRELNLFDFAPAVPAFVLDAILALSQKAVGTTAAAAAAGAQEPAGSLDLLDEIDLKVDLEEKPEEITLELFDEGEEPSGVPEPTVEGPPEVSAVDNGGVPPAVADEELQSLEEATDDLDLKIDGDAAGLEEPGVFDLSDVEDEPELVESADDEAMSDEALERLRRELESAGGVLKDIEESGPAQAADSPSAGVLEPELSREALEIEEDLQVQDVEGVDTGAEKEDKEEDVFILMEERDGGLAVQEFSLEETPSEEAKDSQPQDEVFVLDLDALTDEGEPKPVKGKTSETEEAEIDGLVLELEDGFFIEPDDENER